MNLYKAGLGHHLICPVDYLQKDFPPRVVQQLETAAAVRVLALNSGNKTSSWGSGGWAGRL